MALEEGEGSASRSDRSLPLETPGTHCTGGWVGPRVGLDRCGKSRPPPGILSPDRPARSQSLCRLRYPVHEYGKYHFKFLNRKLCYFGIIVT